MSNSVVHASDLVSITAGNSLCKYADDTYVSNHLSRSAELDNIQTWANHNNLHLNRAKCVEIVFSQTRRRRPIDPPPPLPDITRVPTIKILGVTITNKLSVSDQLCHTLVCPVTARPAHITTPRYGTRTATNGL